MAKNMRASQKRIATRPPDSGPQVGNGNGNAAAKRARRNPQVMPADSMEDMVQAGKEYRKDLLTRFYKVKMGAEDVCVSAYHHTRSGGLGAADIALKPSSSSNSMRHIRKVLAFNKDKPLQAFIYVPQWNAAKACREIRPLEIRWPHESISHDFERRPHLYDKSRFDPSDYESPSYTKHPITMKHGPSTLPVGYYSDKVALGKNDSFYRGSGGCTYVRERRTFWIIRQCDICKCGCGGACTNDAIQIEMNNSFNKLQDGEYMTERRDGRPWLKSDEWRKQKTGQECHTDRSHLRSFPYQFYIFQTNNVDMLEE